MHAFDRWLIERLIAGGSLCLGDPAPDVPAGIRLYQESKGIAVTGDADAITIWELRRDHGERPGMQHVICLPIPSPIGSLFTARELQHDI